MKNDNNKPIEFEILAQVKGNTSLSNRFQLKKARHITERFARQLHYVISHTEVKN